MADNSFEDVNPAANASISSASSNEGSGFITSKKFTLGRSKHSRSKDINNKKMKKKNKITKDDFFSKTAEFRTWLHEKKGIAFDSLGTPKAKELFKKFVKKWNGKKLNEKYYELSAYWAATSPAAYSHQAVPNISDEQSRGQLKASTFTPLYDQDFSTFGKRAGVRALRELQGMQPDTPSHGDAVYAEPSPVNETNRTNRWCEDHSKMASIRSTGGRRAKHIRPRPLLSQMFEQPDDMSSLPSPDEDNPCQPVFAQITRQRAQSCYGRVQKSEPERPLPPSLPETYADQTQGKLRKISKRPKSEYTSKLRSRCKPKPPQRTTSIYSATSRGSRSQSGSSIESTTSSTTWSTTDVTEHLDKTAVSESGIGSITLEEPQYVIFQKSSDAQSEAMRQVTQSVLAKQTLMAASPVSSRVTRSSWSDSPTLTPPPPPPVTSSPGIRPSVEDPLPPPPSPTQLAMSGPTLPPPPPLPPTTQKLPLKVKPGTTQSSTPHVLRTGTRGDPDVNLAPRIVQQYPPHTPIYAAPTGLNLTEVIAARAKLVTPGGKLRKRPSSECLESLRRPSKRASNGPENGVVDLNRSNMSCRSTCV